MAEQADEGAGEVFVVGQRPRRAAVAVNHDGLALAHAVDHGVATVAGEQGAYQITGTDHRAHWAYWGTSFYQITGTDHRSDELLSNHWHRSPGRTSD
jgi:hypothetical protein